MDQIWFKIGPYVPVSKTFLCLLPNVSWANEVENTPTCTHKVPQSVSPICVRRNDPHVSKARRKETAVGYSHRTQVFRPYTLHCLIPRQISMGLKYLKRQQYQTHAKTVSFAGKLCGVCRQNTSVLQSNSASVLRVQPYQITFLASRRTSQDCFTPDYGSRCALRNVTCVWSTVNCFATQHSVNKALKNLHKTKGRQFVSNFP
jgi:hypothetical protein